MKRPLAATGLIYLTALAIAVCLASIINLTIAIMAAIIGIAAAFIMRDYRSKIIVITIPIVFGFGVMALCRNSAENISAKLGDSTCVISGEVSEIPCQQYGRWYYVIDTDYIGIDEAPQKIRIRLTCRNSIEAKEGDTVCGTVTFIQNEDGLGYDSETALRADGIQARAWCSPYVEPDVIGGESRKTVIKYFPLQLRRSITSAIQDTLPEKYSSMLCAMLLGDTSYLDEEITDDFRSTGIAHLLAVSGLHVSLLTYSIRSFMRKLHMPVKLNILLTMAFILLFMAVTGFSPSVTRAGIMHLMALTARLLIRDADNITAMSLSLLIMCIVNPWSAADIGLQMSVSSTLGLILVAGRLNKDIQRKLNIAHLGFIPRLKSYIIDSLVVSLTAAVFTMPMSAIYFGRVSLISPVTNILCVHAATIFIVIGIISVILSAVPLVGWIFAFPFKLVTIIFGAYLDFTTKTLSNLPLSSVNSGYDYIPYFFFFALAIILAAYATAKYINKPAFTKKAVNSAFCGIFAMLLVSMASYTLTASGGEIIIFNMQDSGVCVCVKNQTHAIISEAGGDSYNLQEINDILSRKGVQKIDAISVSERSDERSALADELIGEYSPDYFVFGGEISDYPFAEKAAKTCDTETLSFGGKISVKDLDISIEMYTDSSGGGWQFLHCTDTDVLICPTDGDCALLPQQYRSCDVVIIGEDVKNITYLTTGAVVITTESDCAFQISSELRAKGYLNTYITNQDGTITCTVKNDKLYIQKSN